MDSCRLKSSQEKFGMQTIMVALLTRIMDSETVSHVGLNQLSHTTITIPCQRNHRGMPTDVVLLHLPMIESQVDNGRRVPTTTIQPRRERDRQQNRQ